MPTRTRRHRGSGSGDGGKIAARMPRGRPKQAPTRTYNVRVLVSDFEEWERAAAHERCEVADIVRRGTNAEAKRVNARHEQPVKPSKR